MEACTYGTMSLASTVEKFDEDGIGGVGGVVGVACSNYVIVVGASIDRNAL